VTSSWRVLTGASGAGADEGFVQLAGVVGVGVDGGDLEGDGFVLNANGFQLSEGDLQRDAVSGVWRRCGW